MARKPAHQESIRNPRRRRGRTSVFTPSSAVEELDLPLPESQERFRDNVLTLLLAAELTRREERKLVWSARRDTFKRALREDPAHPERITSPTIEQLWAEAVEDAALNARNVLAERASIKTAITMRERQIETLAQGLAGSSPKPEEAPAANLPAYQARRQQLAARAAAEAERTRAAQRAEELDQLRAELFELRELDERLHLDAILSTIAARYEKAARFYLARARPPRNLRGYAPKPLRAADLYRELQSGLDGAWVDITASGLPTERTAPEAEGGGDAGAGHLDGARDVPAAAHEPTSPRTITAGNGADDTGEVTAPVAA